MIELHIPEEIHYECTGCGKCCGGWAVPLTEEDYDRISEKDWAALSPERYGYKDVFRPMKDYEMVGTPYTHAIKQGDDGHCPFLVDNLCFIHSKFGSEVKPSICQLFPYCFNETPTGVYATVSFNSMGVVWNSGKALREQEDYLQKKYGEFQKLYPDHHPNWDTLKYAVGIPMAWEQYLEHEGHLLGFLRDRTIPIEQRMLRGSEYLFSQLPNRPAPSMNEEQKLKRLDRHLLIALHKIYFPVKPLGRGEGDFNVGRFLYQVAFQGTGVRLLDKSYRLEDLRKITWPEQDPEIEDLLFRYFLSRIFGKFYFGAGFGQLSLITGFHHLMLVLALLKLQAKGYAKSRDVSQVSLVDLIAAIRQAEKRLGETALDGYAAAVWELLMFSPQRVRRVLSYI